MKQLLEVTVEFEVEVDIERGTDPQVFTTHIDIGSFRMMDGTAVSTKVLGYETVGIETLYEPTIRGLNEYRG